MCGDGFAFTVRIRGEIDSVHTSGQLLQPGNNFLFAGDDDVFGFEVVLDIHAESALGQIFDVPERGLNGVAFAQILLNGFRLGGRFDDDESFWQWIPQLVETSTKVRSCQLSALSSRFCIDWIKDANILFTSTTPPTSRS